MFAKAHYIDDGHAMRSLDSRLGTAFNFVLLLVVVALFVFVFTEDNTTETSALVPSSSLNVSDISYGSLNLTVQTFGSNTNAVASCATSVAVVSFSKGLDCTSTITPLPTVETVLACRVEMKCDTKSTLLLGHQQVLFGLPDAFQTMEWFVSHSFWDINQLPSTFHHVLGPSKTMALVGTRELPTLLHFGAIRGIRNDTRRNTNPNCQTTIGGLQLSWKNAQRMEAANQGTEQGRHYVAMEFEIETTTFLKMLTNKLSVQNQLSVVITYVLSVIGVLKIIKIVLQLMIDFCFRKSNKKLPEDVQRRTHILEEVGLSTNVVSAAATSDTTTEVSQVSEIELAIAREFSNPMKRSGKQGAAKRGDGAMEKEIAELKKRQQEQNKALKEQNKKMKKLENLISTLVVASGTIPSKTTLKKKATDSDVNSSSNTSKEVPVKKFLDPESGRWYTADGWL